MTGIFIVLEGIDGAGKSSLCERLGEALSSEGRKVCVTQEPTHDEIGAFIRRAQVKGISQAAEALLFVADRAVHTERICKMLEDGTDVICDRYFASTVAYQSAHLYGCALDADWLLEVNRPIVREPDVTFLLDVDPEKGMERVGSRGARSKFEDAGYLKEVRATYLELAKKFSFVTVDASKGRDEVFFEAIRKIKEMI
ncbi:MAG: dTMP kinase [Candidatus Methanoplasma sp.]|jgi:dTMP kinase|nr:dTMP kinase [Candidatus Methanoplasma sp.]